MKKILILIMLLGSSITLGQETPPKEVPIVMVPAPETLEVDEKVNKRKIYDWPDQLADFKGGSEAMQKFIIDNVHYPEKAVEEGIRGRVYLSFVVKRNGKIVDVTVERGAHILLDREAKRLISIMPKWKPAKHKGKKVNSICRVPINFTLN